MNIFDKLREGVTTGSAEHTRAVAAELAAALPADCTLALHGDLGCGKTTFVGGLAAAWGIEEPVTSPTFNLFTIHRGARMLIHLDAYRLHSADDMDALMMEEFMKSPYCIAVEWPENIQGWLPEDAVELRLTDTGRNRRKIELAGK